MARYEHLPIYWEAYDLTVHIEKIVRSFSRYHKYTLGTDLRNKIRAVLERVIEANNTQDRTVHHGPAATVGEPEGAVPTVSSATQIGLERDYGKVHTEP